MNIARHLAMKPDERIGSLLVNPGGPGLRRQRFRGARRAELRPGAARPFRHRRLGPARHRRQRAGDRLHRRLRPLLCTPATSRPTTQAERQQLDRSRRGVHHRLRRQERRLLPVRRHQQLGPRHGRDPRSARRGDDQLLRVQLRQRARRHVGDAVPRHGARRRARRAVDPDADSVEQRRPAGHGLRGQLDHVPRPCSADAKCAFHNGGDAEGAFDA